MRIQIKIDSRPNTQKIGLANYYNETDAINSRYQIHYYLEVLAIFDINPNVDDCSSLLYVYLRFMSITTLDRRCTLRK